MPEFEINWHHEVICEYLDKFIAKDILRLMIFTPPRHSKSELVSRRLPAYILGHNPDARIIAASYGADLARDMNRDVQRIIDDAYYAELFPNTQLFGTNVRTDARGVYLRNSDTFEVVGYKGRYSGAGIGGALTGKGLDYGIIDDPLKNREAANSLRIRNAVWNFYRSVILGRRDSMDSAILLTMTRWHEDDLAARLIALAESDPDADQWTVLSFPAIAEEPIAEYDIREPGEALWRNKFDEQHWTNTRASALTYEWNAQYQQRPSAPEGNRIKRHWFGLVDRLPADARYARYWDKAGTQDGGAYTAGVLMAEHKGHYTIVDVVRVQLSAMERERLILATSHQDKLNYGRVDIYVEQEPGSGGKESAQSTIRNLAGYNIRADRPSGDKDTRLYPFEAQAEAGHVSLVKDAWNIAYLDELTMIPNGKYRDQADATSGAFNMLVKHQAAKNIHRTPRGEEKSEIIGRKQSWR